MSSANTMTCGVTRFVNDRRPVGKSYEGHGEYRTTWVDYEYKCPCDRWFRGIGDVSAQVADDPNEHEWLCAACIAEYEPVLDADGNEVPFIQGA